MTSIEKFLCVHHIAERLVCSKNHIYNLIKDGKIEAIRVGGHLRIKESAFDIFLEQNKVDAEKYYE